MSENNTFFKGYDYSFNWSSFYSFRVTSIGFTITLYIGIIIIFHIIVKYICNYMTVKYVIMKKTHMSSVV